MRELITCSPQYRTKLEESLLDMISVTLCGLPFRQQGGSLALSDVSGHGDPSEYQISVALNALVQFGFSNSELMGDFLRDSVLPLVDNASTAIRNAAVFAIIKLLVPPGEKGDLSISRRICINTVLFRMLVVALSDPNPLIRQTILSSFTEAFYPFLGEQQFLSRMFAALGDESIFCRAAALEQLCRLTPYDPSHILPALREEVVVILHLVDSTFNPQTVEYGLNLLTTLSSAAPQFIMRFSSSILNSLRPQFSGTTARSPILLPFLNCCTAVATAINAFDKTGRVFKTEIGLVSELFDTIPRDSASLPSRLACLRFLCAALAPLIDGEHPYVLYPRISRQLANIIRFQDENVEVRLEALKCVGLIGALDPHIIQTTAAAPEYEDRKTNDNIIMFGRISHKKCARVALWAIATLLEPYEACPASTRDALLRTSVQTVLNIGERCPCARADMSLLIPPLSRCVCELPTGRLLATILFEFSTIVHYVGDQVSECMEPILNVFECIWEKHRMYRFLVVRLLSHVTSAGGENYFGSAAARALPRVFDSLNRSDSTPELKNIVLKFIVKHISSLQAYAESLVANLLLAIENTNNTQDFLYAAVTTLKVVCSKIHVDELVGSIVRSLLTCLSNDRIRSQSLSGSTSLVNNIMGVFTVLIVLLQTDFLKFSIYINATLKTYKITSPEFTALNNELASGAVCVRSAKSYQVQTVEANSLIKKVEVLVIKSMSRIGEIWSYSSIHEEVKMTPTEDERTLPSNESRILACFKTVPVTKEEWSKWSEQFSISLLQESPYQVFRCTSLPIGINATPLVEKSPQFTSDVLQVAFRAMWTFASVTLRSGIVDYFRQVFRQAMTVSTVPDQVIITILSLVEYMDHMGEVLSLSYADLSECAWSRGLLAKALYWREAAYRENPPDTVESLISVYSELHMVDSSVGILNQASKEQQRSLLHSSLVKLARYREALQLTQKEIENERLCTQSNADNITQSFRGPKMNHRSFQRMMHFRTTSRDNTSSLMKSDEKSNDHRLEIRARLMLCLSELGNFDRVLDEWKKMYKRCSQQDDDSEDGNILYYVSEYAADASIRLGSWDLLEQALEWMPTESVAYHVANASLCIVKEKYETAMSFVRDGRLMLLNELAAVMHETNGRAYRGLVTAQVLTEVEEVAIAKQLESKLGSTEHISVLSRIWDQRIRLMCATVPVWKQILGVRGLLIPPNKDVKTRIRFVKLCRQENAKEIEKFTLDQLLGVRNPTLANLTSRTTNPRVVMQYVAYLSASNALGDDTKFGKEAELLKRIIDIHCKSENSIILAKAYAKLGMNVDLVEAEDCFKTATLYDPKWYIAWRLWAESNAELLNNGYTDVACTNAIEGYIQSIQLGTSDSTLIQDVLKLLTLWSRHCDREKGLKELRSRVFNVPSRVWNLVVPQLIARLDTGSDDSCRLVADVIAGVALQYPHSLIYPLNLCTMSDSERRKKWANEIINRMLNRFPVLVLQGRIMIEELIRTSALIHEHWYDKLEAAASSFFGRGKAKDEMVRLLLPMHESLNRVPETVVEAEFVSKYGKLLAEAKEWLRSYTTTRNIGDLQSAWNIYHIVYKRIDEQIKSSIVLKMEFCSPKLFEARELVIGIPDARSADEGAVAKIYSFQNDVNVIASKQRPKRIGIITNEGKNQKYLLKGREDLRLDERVMQLFGLINILMSSDSRSCKNFGFKIQRYSVTPLKDTVGIIGWVDGCDTLHELVKYYRTKKGIPAELEMRMLHQIISFDNVKAYDYLMMMSKVEVIEYLADHTSGQDIRKAMWSSAADCEIWLERRRMYCTSLANMSVVGYILGLGDRHPNNIMVQRNTGLVVHIDFGDCFEVAMTRDKFPEKVPFRLTRMLRNALDVSGVDGAFRSCAETSMCVLREGSHSVLALMEAFIQDPLISWRLVNRPGQEPEISNDRTIEEQINIAKIRNPTQPHQESFTESLEGGKKGHETLSVAKHLCGEEVDVIHQGVFIFNRLSSKLKGQDFISPVQQEGLDTKTQVGRLIAEATQLSNVAQSWSGWYPFW
ncbi:FKBP12-rapamycin complex-associated protein [Strigomonas culicis]|uniref:Serine/threonine-protein kinase TOR n=1 Tax=Strigomonas culicis TaxID=28005 RepID=S9TQG4_9TRYP|nr:FKBP12-rapamycin complex-associated protein [Strigomonas culicis]|eukprot:EPY18889.1 FKBP12-rapamycin complex-associated protein [Strigomonas culicis]